MQVLVDAYMSDLEQDYWRVDSLKARETTVIVRYGEAGDSAPAEFTVIKLGADLVTSFSYDTQLGVFVLTGGVTEGDSYTPNNDAWIYVPPQGN